MNPMLQRYSRIALFNLLLVALIGVTLRYKIAFSLPFIDQKHLLHGHSHFAFAGWVSHTIMLLFIHYLYKQNNNSHVEKYRWIMNLNLISSYGMLISFPLQGYGLFSMIFSTANIFVSYAFAFVFWKDLNRLAQNSVTHLWMKASLIFCTLSSLGAFSLAFMMATKNFHQHLYLAAVYFFLHFQYNGWFFFAVMGLATTRFFSNVPINILQKIFWLFASACVPAYFLSALWLPIPGWLYILVVAAAISQVLGWVFTAGCIKNQLQLIKSSNEKYVLYLMALVAIALSIKLLLQLGSTIPSLSTLAFGFRPIVIGYLHLVLLCVISLFLLAYLINEQFIELKFRTKCGMIIFAAAIVVNEVLLMAHGIAAMTNKNVYFINEALLITAFFIVVGITLLYFQRPLFASKMKTLNH